MRRQNLLSNRQSVDLDREALIAKLKSIMRSRQPAVSEPLTMLRSNEDELLKPTIQEILGQIESAPEARYYQEGTGAAGMGEALRQAKKLTVGRPEDVFIGDTWLERLFGVTDLLGAAPGGWLGKKAFRQLAETLGQPRFGTLERFGKTPSLGAYILNQRVVDPAIEHYRSDRKKAKEGQ